MMPRLLLILLASFLALACHTEAAGQVVSSLNSNANADVRSAVIALDSSGNATWDFTIGGTAAPFAGVPDVTHIPQAVDTTNPLICNYTARTTSLVTIHCWRTSLTGLLTGLLSGPVTGAQVNLIARYRQ